MASQRIAPKKTVVKVFPSKYQFTVLIDETFTLNVIEDTSDDDPNLENTNVTAIEENQATEATQDTSLRNNIPSCNELNDTTKSSLDGDSHGELVIDLEPQEKSNENSEEKLPTVLNEATTSNEDQTKPHFAALSLSTKNANVSFNCPNCPFGTDTVNKLLHHHQLECKHSPTRFQCPHCHILTLTKKGLNKHIRIYHSENPVFTCPKCPFSTSKWNLVDKHKLKHEIRNFKCALCSYETTERIVLKRHHSLEHSFKCNNCDFKASSMTLLENHILCHVIKSPNAVAKCKICNFMDASPEVVKKHEERHFKRKGVKNQLQAMENVISIDFR